jgi:hypothetical protein
MGIKYDPKKDKEIINVAIIGAGNADSSLLVRTLREQTGKVVIVENLNSSKDIVEMIKRIKPKQPLLLYYYSEHGPQIKSEEDECDATESDIY